MRHAPIKKKLTGDDFTLRAAIFAACLATPATVLADDAPDLLSDPFNVTLGTFILESDLSVRLDGKSDRGTSVDWDKTFGGGDQTRFRVDGHWRFGDSERHKLRFLWFNSSNSGSRTIERDIEFGGQVYPASAKVTGETDFDIYELAYEYALWHTDTYELNASIGLHVADMSLRLAAKAETSNGQLSGDIERDASVAAPLPVIGVRGIWALPHNFWIDVSAQYFALSIDEFDGNLTDFRVGVTWQPSKWLGVGLGYNQFSVDVDIDKPRFNGNLDWTYSGPMIYYSATF